LRFEETQREYFSMKKTFTKTKNDNKIVKEEKFVVFLSIEKPIS
jgi:hypothetical protein